MAIVYTSQLGLHQHLSSYIVAHMHNARIKLFVVGFGIVFQYLRMQSSEKHLIFAEIFAK